MHDDNPSVQRLIDEIIEQGVVDAIGDPVSIQDTDYRILYQNRAHKDIIGDHVGDYCYETYEQREQRCEDCPVAMSLRDGGVHRKERTAPTPTGMVTVEITASALRDKAGAIIAGIEVVRDVTQEIEKRDRLRTLVLTDELTGLYNRRGFMALAGHQLKTAERMRREVMLVFADVNRLKWINDEFGHREGDSALRGTADVLKHVFRESDVIARIGGDEFVVFLIKNGDTTVAALNDRFQQHLDAHNAKRNCGYDLSISVGIADYEHGYQHSIDELLEQADRSMYRTKKGQI
jgi:diguanylate cyclase (GGDEF)-like protein